MKLNLNKGTKYKFMYAFDLENYVYLGEDGISRLFGPFLSPAICPPKYNTKSEREKSEGFLN